MPGMLLYGRRWQVASDDMVVPGLVESVIHLVNLILIIIVYIHSKEGDCINRHAYVVSYFSIYSFAHGSFIILAFATMYVSMLGTPLEVERRKSIVYLIHSAGCLTLLHIALMVVISWTTFDIWRKRCDVEEYNFLKASLIVYWSFLGCRIGFWLCFFDTVAHSHMEYYKPWRWRCRLCFCCTDRPEKHKAATANLTEDATHMFSALFRWLDLVPSDIVAGLICLNAQERLSGSNALSHDLHPKMDHSASPPASVLLDLAHFSKYFMGCYGWPVLAVHHPLSCCCRLCGHCTPGVPHNGDPFYANVAAILSYTGLRREDLLFVKMRNEVFTPAYYIAVDHSAKAVVLAFRGTRSLEDAMTDLALKLVPFQIEGLGFPIPCHEGFVRATENSLEELKADHLLDDALVKYPSYRLVVLGHSLGAAVATLVSMALRVKYGSRVNCFAYAPPQLFTKRHLHHALDHVISCVLWKDVVPRLCLRSIARWRDHIISALAHCKFSKFSVISNPLFSCFTTQARKKKPEDLVWRTGTSEIANKLLERFRQTTELERQRDLSQSLPSFGCVRDPGSPNISGGEEEASSPGLDAIKHIEEYPQLYPPGRIVHILRCPKPPRKSAEAARATGGDQKHMLGQMEKPPNIPLGRRISQVMGNRCPATPSPTPFGAYRKFVAEWAPPERFKQIQTSPSMLKNHMPWALHQVLKYIVENTEDTPSILSAASPCASPLCASPLQSVILPVAHSGNDLGVSTNLPSACASTATLADTIIERSASSQVEASGGVTCAVVSPEEVSAELAQMV